MTLNSCVSCRKAQDELSNPLQRCGACQNPFYCSKECQKLDWKTHKKLCGSDYSKKKFFPINSHSKPITAAVISPLLFPGDEHALHTISQADVFCVLVDCFRMRVEDEYKFQGNNMGCMNPFDHSDDDDGPPPGVEDFEEFLDLAQSRNSVLPKWWSPKKRELCMEFSLRTMMGEYKYHGHAEGSILTPTGKSDIQEHYEDNMMPMKLRMLAELIYGTSVMRH